MQIPKWNQQRKDERISLRDLIGLRVKVPGLDFRLYQESSLSHMKELVSSKEMLKFEALLSEDQKKASNEYGMQYCGQTLAFLCFVFKVKEVSQILIRGGRLNAEINENSGTLIYSDSLSLLEKADYIYQNMFKESHSTSSSSSAYSNTSTSTRGTRQKFRSKLLAHCHQNGSRPMLRCEPSNKEYPAEHVRAGHIFKKSFGDSLLNDFFNLNDIHEPSNGILMYAPIEYHFDHGNLCLLKNSCDNHYHIQILSDELKNKLIIDEAKKVLKSSYHAPSETTMTFNDLEQQHVDLPGRSKRLVCFHASLAIKRHETNHDHSSINIIEFWSPESIDRVQLYEQKVKAWFELNEKDDGGPIKEDLFGNVDEEHKQVDSSNSHYEDNMDS
ncbi:unnamed protein product [Didymodactylos carnosus]|uniref:HNH nuclease domain-containing protein n=1 Tax=Didymodactylos carnosus TaxID=1234261 RepID=A0A815G5E9_9BILA|nr:unnamed protein product [Didymodactylos carnosus]CAF4190373.1 unnamed protein product [Didymodactylos carnosus]